MTSQRAQNDAFFPQGRGINPQDPPEFYSFFREHKPIAKVRLWNGKFVWMFTRWEDVRAVLLNPNVSAMPSKPGFPTFSAGRAAQLGVRRTFINMDSPEHGFYRRMLTKEFSVKRLEEQRPAIQALSDQLLDKMIAGGGPADLRAAYAMPLPATIISRMLGVPFEHHDQLRDWTETRNMLSADPEIVRDAATKMLELISEILKDKEKNPGEGDDLLQRLAIEYILPGVLSHDDAVQMASLLYAAGHDTSANQIALGALSLLQNPSQLEALKADPALLKPAIEEMLRFSTIVHLNSARVATADFEIGGETIRAGDGIYALISAANRDPSKFAYPDVFDIFRPANEHLAFSFGVHQCLGHALARIELEVAIETLFRRLPNLRLAVPEEELSFDDSNMVFHVKTLPVVW